MTVDWLAGYEHDPEPGAGHSPLPGRRKVIVHTTETGPGSWGAVRNLWRGPSNWAQGLPHFLAEGDRYVQLLPLSTCAYTSKGGPDAANKAGTPIQVEVVGRAAEGLSDVDYEAMGRWIADLIAAGVDLDLDQCPRFFGSGEGMVLATESSPVRRIITDRFGGFASFNGICGHQHLRGNDHWDPGALDVERVCSIARSHLGLTHQHGDAFDMATPQDVITPLAEQIAKVDTDLAGYIEQARKDIIGSLVNVQDNLAGVIRGASAETLQRILEQLASEGHLPGEVDVADLAGRVADLLTVTPKT